MLQPETNFTAVLTASRTDVIANLHPATSCLAHTLRDTGHYPERAAIAAVPAGTEGGSRAAVRPNEVTGCAEYRLATDADALCSAVSDLFFLFLFQTLRKCPVSVYCNALFNVVVYTAASRVSSPRQIYGVIKLTLRLASIRMLNTLA